MSWETWWRDLSDSNLMQQEFHGNSLPRWIAAATVFVASLFLMRLAAGIVRRRAGTLAERRKSDVAQAVVGVAAATKWWFLLVVSLFLGSLVVNFPDDKTAVLVEKVVLTVLLLQLAVWSDVLIALFLDRYMQRRMETDAASVTMMSTLTFLARVAVWTMTVLWILENLNAHISTLVAGLGIGGVAVALAAQNVLGDLFASLAIVLDKPFILGDFIAVEDFLGSVEHIGIKTTRLRSLSGEQLVFSNSDLLKGRIRNYKRMYERRIQFSFGVEYGTPYEKMTAIPGMLREAIAAAGRTRFDRAHFKAFGDSSLVFESVYYVLSPDYNLYMDIQQSINLWLMKRFAEEGIQFAFPTQTLYVHKIAAAPSGEG
ncbi:MAG TPA: mechanosensitive ion channel family protein [Pirellulales bacterium]|nr:mechanosensitive ion channel family protein [Pirellulales bacterium]